MSFHRLIASDVDGTLIPEESTFMPEIMWQRIEEIWEKGCLFIAASGRQYPSLRALFAPVADHMAFLAENGAGLYYRDELVAERFFDRQLALELARYVREIPGCELIAGGVESCIFPKTQAFADHVYREMKLQVREVHSFDELPEKMMKIAIWCPDGVENHVDAISRDWGGRVKFAVSGSVWIDFNAADKGLGLTSACDYFGVTPEQVISFGDNWNDVPMLDLAGEAYLMYSAPAELANRYPRRCASVPDELPRIMKNI